MMTFSEAELISSVVYALIYGILFACLLSATQLVKEILLNIKTIGREMLMVEKIFPLPRFRNMKIQRDLGAGLSVLSIFIYAIGFSLLSYLALDGEIRLYMFLLSFASFYLSKFVFFEFLTNVFLKFFRLLLILLSFAVRPVFFIIKKFINSIKSLSNIIFARK